MANLTAKLGVETECRDHLTGLAHEGFAEVAFEDPWLVCMAFLAEAVAALGDTTHAAILYERLLPYADRVAVTYPEVAIGSVARYVGLLATTIRRWDDAEGHFEDAVGTNKRIGAKPWLAHTQNDYARMLLARDAPGDSGKARLLAAQAAVSYRHLGMQADGARTAVDTHNPAGVDP
jgi:hypothetical protein